MRVLTSSCLSTLFFSSSYLLLSELLGQSWFGSCIALLLALALFTAIRSLINAQINGETTRVSLRELAYLLLSHLPFFYFASFIHGRAAHVSIDMLIITGLFGLLMCSTGLNGIRNKERAHVVSSQDFAFAALLVLLSLALRLTDLSYNAPFIDELLNFEIASIGNAYFIAADSRLWGVVCRFAYDLGGLAASRAANAVLGSLCVGTLYFLALALSPGKSRLRVRAIVAALCFSLSSPVLFTSVLATHDMLALLFFTQTLLWILFGSKTQRRELLLVAALCLFFAFASRYFIFVIFPSIALLTHGPLSLVDKTSRTTVADWFYKPLIAFFATYFIFDGEHIYDSIRLGVELSGQVSELQYPLVMSALLLFILPQLLALLLLFVSAPLLGTANLIGQSARSRTLLLYLIVSAAILPLIQIVKCSDFGSEKNLSYALLFLSLLFGQLVGNCFDTLSRSKVRVCAYLLCYCVVFMSLLSVITDRLVPLAIRSEHAEAKTRAVSKLKQAPYLAPFSVTLQLMKQRWLDPKPVYDHLKRLGLDKQNVAVFGLYGGEHLNWYLTHYMGRDPESKQYYANQTASWKKDFFRYVAKKRIPVLLAVLPETEVDPFERLYEFPQYHFLDSFQHPDIEGPYGRTYFLVDPRQLDSDELHTVKNEYLLAFRNYTREIPRLVNKAKTSQAEALMAVTNAMLESNPSIEQRASLMLEQASAYTALGRSEEAKRSLQNAQDIAQTDLQHQRFVQRAKLRVSQLDLFSTAQHGDTPAGLDAKSENLLPLTTLATTNPRDAARNQARAFWLDFDPPLEIPAGSALRIESTLHNSDSQALRLIDGWQDLQKPLEMIHFPNSKGRRIFYIWHQERRMLKRIDFQVGPSAWGKPIGGSMLAEVDFHSVSVETINQADLYLSAGSKRIR